MSGLRECGSWVILLWKSLGELCLSGVLGEYSLFRGVGFFGYCGREDFF